VKKKLVLILLAVSLAFNLAVVMTFGHHWMMKKYFAGGHDAPPMFFKHKLKKMLDLTDQQVEQMEKDHQEMRKTMDPMREELQKKRDELFALVDADPVDEKKIDQLISDISLSQAKIEKAIINHSINMRKGMTPDQQKKFKEFIHKNFKKGPPPQERGCMNGEKYPSACNDLLTGKA
jgi:Spy/CpxP family protein refolding chaperone